MNAREELILRCARRREAALGGLSPAAFEELKEAVRSDVASFIDTPQEAAFAEVMAMCDAFARNLREADALDDEAYGIARAKMLDTLRKSARQALSTDQGCVDAHHIFIISAPQGIGSPDRAYDQLLDTYRDSNKQIEALSSFPGGLNWENVFMHPHLRLLAALARHCVACTRYRLALEWGDKALALAPNDEVGVRHSMALAYARLEDEAGLNALDDRFQHESTAWSLLARTILLYRLERYPAAKRALRGYVQLVNGGAFALLRPVLLPPYVPDRPTCEPLSFDAALQAIYEAESILADTPGFVWWAQNQPNTIPAAKHFADANGYEWDE